jgi:hypothetical protein
MQRFIGRKAIIRARDAGVWFGVVDAIDGRTVVLSQARRIWRWRGALTLSHLATEGTPLDASWTRIAGLLSEPTAILDACEVLLCSPESIARLDAVAPWTA